MKIIHLARISSHPHSLQSFLSLLWPGNRHKSKAHSPPSLKKTDYWHTLMRTNHVALLLISVFLWSCQGMEANSETSAAQKHVDPAMACETGLFTGSTKQGSVKLDNDPTIADKRFVGINFDLLAGDSSGKESDANLLHLNLFEKACHEAVLDRKDVRGLNDFTWLGKIKGIEQSQVTLVVKDQVMAGTIMLKRKLYKVRYVGDGVHAILLVNQAAYGLD